MHTCSSSKFRAKPPCLKLEFCWRIMYAKKQLCVSGYLSSLDLEKFLKVWLDPVETWVYSGLGMYLTLGTRKAGNTTKGRKHVTGNFPIIFPFEHHQSFVQLRPVALRKLHPHWSPVFSHHPVEYRTRWQIYPYAVIHHDIFTSQSQFFLPTYSTDWWTSRGKREPNVSLLEWWDSHVFMTKVREVECEYLTFL